MLVAKESKSVYSILTGAKSLFWKYGIKRVTIEEICREASVSKMTFYRNFTDKNDLAERVLEKFIRHSLAGYKQIMSQASNFEERVATIIQYKYENTVGISNEFITDIFQDHHTGLQKQLGQYQTIINKAIIKDFKKARKEGLINPELKSGFILYILNDLNKKLVDNDLADIFPNKNDLVTNLTSFFFHGILKGVNKHP